MFQQFRDWYNNRHDYAKLWKEKTGGKVVGGFCSYVPEEIMYAAGALPVRVLGSHEPQDVTEPHIFGMFCPFCRDVLAQGLRGRMNYLDGIVIAQSCLHLRQAFTSWKHHIPVDFNYYLPMPNNVQSRAARKFYAGELAKFKSAIEEWTGQKITDEALQRSIDIHNENRRLMRQVYEMRQGPNPPVTGEEAMIMVASAELVDKAEHNEALKKVLAQLPTRKLDRDPGIRLMMVGSENDDVAFVNMVEKVGATIVVDDHCTGSRYFWNESENNADKLLEISNRYCDRPACPTKDYVDRTRFPHVLKLAKDYGAQGVLLIQQKFCDPHECDIPDLRDYLNANGLPTLFLEFDVTVPLGPFRIRVEAFLEMLRQDDLF